MRVYVGACMSGVLVGIVFDVKAAYLHTCKEEYVRDTF